MKNSSGKPSALPQANLCLSCRAQAVALDIPGDFIESIHMRERSLYECFHARVKGNRIYCGKGRQFCAQGGWDGTVNIGRLARGEPLVMSVCQDCADFERMGGPIPCEERGWLKEATPALLSKIESS